MIILAPFRNAPVSLPRIHRNPYWHLSRAAYWEIRLLNMMASPMPFDARRNARLHALLLRVNRVKAAANMAIFLSQDEGQYYV